MQHKQFNFVQTGTKAAIVTLLLLGGGSVSAGTIVHPSKPDPLLDGGPTAPCAAGADYAPATDVHGNSVIPAEVAARPVPLPDGVAIPLGGNRTAGTPPGRGAGSRPANPATLGSEGTYVTLDGRKLEPLLNPPPPCSVSQP